MKVLIKIFKYVAKVPAMRHTCPYWQIMFMGDSYTNNQSGGGDFQNQRQNGRNNFRGGRGPTIEREAFVFA